MMAFDGFWWFLLVFVGFWWFLVVLLVLVLFIYYVLFDLHRYAR